MKFLNYVLPVACAALGAAAGASDSDKKIIVYWDQWHQNGNVSNLNDVTHVMLSFVDSGWLANDTWVPLNTTAPEPGFAWHKNKTDEIRAAWPEIKIGIALGGWGDVSGGFRKAVTSPDQAANFARNIKTLLDERNWDGVDIDWEYPGGNGIDYKDGKPKNYPQEIENYPDLLVAIREEIGDEKELSIATPGKEGDMMAFTTEENKKIWDSVDFVNVMSYDLFNRRDTEMKHHSSFKDTKTAIGNYIEQGCPPEKIILGIAFYAKWAKAEESCTEETGLGCPTVVLEFPNNGTDTGFSGAMTYEAANLDPPPTNIQPATEGACGATEGNLQCPESYCCSSAGFCGNTTDHCGFGKSQMPFNGANSPAQGPDLYASWRAAFANPDNDEDEGAVSYFDQEWSVFWTWDSPEYISKKIKEIVGPYKLGGVMAWGFGHENMQTQSSLNAIREGVGACAKVGDSPDYPAGLSPPVASYEDFDGVQNDYTDGGEGAYQGEGGEAAAPSGTSINAGVPGVVTPPSDPMVTPAPTGKPECVVTTITVTHTSTCLGV